jgi:hypothetical protein
MTKKDEFGQALGTCKGTGVRRGFWWEKLKGRGRLENLGEDGGIILKILKEIRQENVDLCCLARDWEFGVSFERKNELKLP